MTVARSDKTRPTRKCWCLNSVDNVEKFALKSAIVVEEYLELCEEMLGDGDDALVAQTGVPNGRFKVKKCS